MQNMQMHPPLSAVNPPNTFCVGSNLDTYKESVVQTPMGDNFDMFLTRSYIFD